MRDKTSLEACFTALEEVCNYCNQKKRSISLGFFLKTFFRDGELIGSCGCPLLGAYIYNREKTAALIRDLFGEVRLSCSEFSNLHFTEEIPECLLNGLVYRLSHILFVDGLRKNIFDQDKTKNFLRNLVNCYTNYFNTRCWQECRSLLPRAGIDFQRSGLGARITESDFIDGNSLLKDVVNVFVDLAKDQAMLPPGINPAFYFVVETTLIALGYDPFDSSQEQEPGDRSVGSTWGVAAVSDVNVVKVTMRGCFFRIVCKHAGSGQSGSLVHGIPYPNPFWGAFIPLDHNFQNGIRNAWLLCADDSASKPEIRYSLIPVSTSDVNLLVPLMGVNGNSMSAAFAIAIKSLRTGSRLRSDAVCSASIEFNGTKNYSDDTLSSVGKILRKLFVVDVFNTLIAEHKDKIHYFCWKQDGSLVIVDERKLKNFEKFHDVYQFFQLSEKNLEEFSEYSSGRWMRIGGKQPYSE